MSKEFEKLVYGDMDMHIEQNVPAHKQKEEEAFLEIIPEHINRGEASQTIFNRAKKQLKSIYGGKRCIVCEARGEDYTAIKGNQIESHHVFEWCHWNDNDMKMVEVTLRALSPFIHGLYMIDKEKVLNGEPIPSLWNHDMFKHVPFDSLDDARNQFFLCHSHHQQATHEQIAAGHDAIGIHHVPFTIWLQYLGMPKGKVPVQHMTTSGIHLLDPVVD
jgi:hypothetical protein